MRKRPAVCARRSQRTTHTDVARDALNEGELNEALVQVNRALDLYPSEALFHSLRGAIRMRQERWGDAVTNFNRAVDADRTYFAHYLQRGLAHYKLKNNDAAQRDLDQSVRILPTAVAYNALGQLAEARGDTTAAQRYYEQAAGSGGATGKAARSRLVALQIDSSPAKFVRSEVRRDGAGQVWLIVANVTDLPLKDIAVRVELQSSAGTKTETLRVASLAAGRSVQSALPGSAELLNARAYAVAASIAE